MAGEDAANPRIGVVVLTHNRIHSLTRTLERLVALPERPAIVVVDNGSSDGTAAMVGRRFPGVACIHVAENIGAAGRNIGVEACDRPYVALCDDDTWWEPGSLARAVVVLDSHPALAVLTGTVLVYGERVDPTCLLMANSPLPSPTGLPGRAILGFLAGASIIRRAAFLAVGGFEQRLFIGAEEALLTLDLASQGWALAYLDDLIIHHYPTAARDVMTRRRLLARNVLWIAWLRRPYRHAIAQTLVTLRGEIRNRTACGMLQETIRAAPWIAANRRCIAAHIEWQLRQIEAKEPRSFVSTSPQVHPRRSFHSRFERRE